jgi:hypothetical protein
MQVAATDAPTVVEYLPAAHATHALSATAPVVVRYLPAPQLVQPALPVVALCLPATHAEHVPPSSPEKPATHTQSVLPLNDCEFGGQSVQPRVPTVFLNLPASHAKHSGIPVHPTEIEV